MFTYRRLMPAVLALTAAARLCSGEDPAPAKFYKLDFVIKEVEGVKVLNSRAYSLSASDGAGHNSIRAGSKIPYSSGNKGSLFQLIDVGVSIDVINIKEIQNRLTFTLAAEITSMGAESVSENSPTIRQNKWNSAVLIPLKKAIVVFSSDNLDAKSQLQIEVTATPIP